MITIAKLGHAAFETANIDAMAAYYQDVLGFSPVERGPDGTAYFSCGADHHTIALHPGTSNRIMHVGLQLGGHLSVSDAARSLRDEGIACEVRTDAEPGFAEVLELADPEGNRIQLYAECASSGNALPTHGVAPLKLGHIATFVHDPQGAAVFYERALGFRWSDWIGDFFVFMRCGPDHHTLNFLHSPENRRINHIAFELRDWSQIETACDHLAAHAIPLMWGPGRHGPGHNLFTYHRDPEGRIVELFAELDRMDDESLGYFTPRPWHEDRPQKPKVWEPTPLAVNRWGIGLPDDFMQ